ncbi:MAG: nucleotidyltransferase domain-containing protein [Candidatus Hydrothermarchaeota archaeon]
MELINKFIGLLRRNFGSDLVSVVLFGSYTTDKHTWDSDIDLLVVLDNLPENQMIRSELTSEIVSVFNLKHGITISPIFLTRKEAKVTQPFYLDMVSEGQILYDRGEFMKKKLEEVRRKLEELGAKKEKLPDGTIYWNLKPKMKRAGEIEL